MGVDFQFTAGHMRQNCGLTRLFRWTCEWYESFMVFIAILKYAIWFFQLTSRLTYNNMSILKELKRHFQFSVFFRRHKAIHGMTVCSRKKNHYQWLACEVLRPLIKDLPLAESITERPSVDPWDRQPRYVKFPEWTACKIGRKPPWFDGIQVCPIWH